MFNSNRLGKHGRDHRGNDPRLKGPRCHFVPALLVMMSVGLPCLAQSPPSSATLDEGYRQMYNLEFTAAHATFKNWEDLHPNDPLGPTSDAAAYLFSEFDRLGLLQSELFIDDEKFDNRSKLAPDPAARKGFELAIAKSEQLADMVLMTSPRDENALFSKVLNGGLRSDYLGLVEKKSFASLREMKSAGILSEQLLMINPMRYDAYLAIGVENYLLGLKPAPMRWMLRMYGAEADKDAGVARLELTAEKGQYLRPFAKLLLAVAALRDKKNERARELLGDLVQEFPNNKLYGRELARIH
jgi:hypothetical protein